MQLTVLAGVVTAVRCGFNWNRSFFNIHPDGPAHLGMARWISGTGPWHMFDMSVWRPGFATLVAPLFWLTDDPEVVIRLTLAVNATLGGLAAVVLARLMVRLTDLSAPSILIAAGLIASMPAALAASAHVWAEPLVTLCFLALLWLVLDFFDGGRWQAAASGIVVAAVAATVHGRLLPTAVTAVPRCSDGPAPSTGDHLRGMRIARAVNGPAASSTDRGAGALRP